MADTRSHDLAHARRLPSSLSRAWNPTRTHRPGRPRGHHARSSARLLQTLMFTLPPRATAPHSALPHNDNQCWTSSWAPKSSRSQTRPSWEGVCNLFSQDGNKVCVCCLGVDLTPGNAFRPGTEALWVMDPGLAGLPRGPRAAQEHSLSSRTKQRVTHPAGASSPAPRPSLGLAGASAALQGVAVAGAGLRPCRGCCCPARSRAHPGVSVA